MKQSGLALLIGRILISDMPTKNVRGAGLHAGNLVAYEAGLMSAYIVDTTLCNYCMLFDSGSCSRCNQVQVFVIVAEHEQNFCL
jgi:hypothetical protein